MQGTNKSGIYRSLTVMQQAAGGTATGVGHPMIATMMKDNSNSLLKESAVVDAKKTSSNQHRHGVVAIDAPLPMSMYPLSMSHVYLKDSSQLELVMKQISTCLNGKLISNLGRIDAQAANSTNIRVAAIRDSANGKVVLEFDRLEGCAFVFRWAFLKAICECAEFLEIDQEETRQAYSLSEQRLAFWLEPGSEVPNDYLVSLMNSVVLDTRA
jgi:hypothetical protein